MKYLLMGDTHFGHRNNSNFVFSKCIKIFDLAEKLCKEHNVEYFVHYGDLFHNQSILNKSIVQLTKQRILELVKLMKQSWFIPGNHDTYYRNATDITSQSMLFDGFENEKIVNVTKPMMHGKMVFVPWINDGNREDIQKFFESGIDFSNSTLNGHFDKAGFKMTGNYISDVDSLPENISSLFPIILSGHYHGQQLNDKKWKFLGTPFETKKGEEFTPHGLYIYDSDTKELQFFEYEFSKFYLTYNTQCENFDDWKKKADTLDFKDKFVECSIVTHDQKFISAVSNYLSSVEAYEMKFSVFSPESDAEAVIDIKDFLSKKISVVDIAHKLVDEAIGSSFDAQMVSDVKKEIELIVKESNL